MKEHKPDNISINQDSVSQELKHLKMKFASPTSNLTTAEDHMRQESQATPLLQEFHSIKNSSSVSFSQRSQNWKIDKEIMALLRINLDIWQSSTKASKWKETESSTTASIKSAKIDKSLTALSENWIKLEQKICRLRMSRFAYLSRWFLLKERWISQQVTSPT